MTTTFLLQISWGVYFFFLPFQLSLHRTIEVKYNRKTPPHTVCHSSLCVQEDLKCGQTLCLQLSWSTVSSFYFNFEPCIYNNYFFFIKEKEKKESKFI